MLPVRTYPANIHCWADVGKLSGLLAERRDSSTLSGCETNGKSVSARNNSRATAAASSNVPN